MNRALLDEVAKERDRQDKKWGKQHHEDGTDPEIYGPLADDTRRSCELLAATGGVHWLAILSEEVLEAFAEVDAEPLRKELLQVAAVCLNWIEDIDSRGAK